MSGHERAPKAAGIVFLEQDAAAWSVRSASALHLTPFLHRHVDIGRKRLKPPARVYNRF